MDEEEKRKRVAAKLKGDYLQSLSDDDVLEGFEGTYSKALAELEVAKEELFKQIRRQAKTDKLLLIAMYAFIISAVVIVLFT